MSSPSRTPVRHARILAAITMAFVLGGGGALAAPSPAAAATTTSTVEAKLLALTNRDRAARGLRPLRRDARLAAVAGERAARLTGAATFSHAAAGDLSKALAAGAIQWYAWGENIAWRSGGLRSTTAGAIYNAWRGSPSHWAQLMSRRFNYLGFGVEVRPSDGRVFASAVFTESRDHTVPRARIDTATRSGRTITFTWHGYDAPLQTHWAGLRDFDVWYRVDGGTWRLIRDNTTATSLRLSSRASGHRYWLMVRARDRVSNVGPKSAPYSIWVP